MDREEQIKLFMQKAKEAGASKEQTFAAIKRKFPDYFVSESNNEQQEEKNTSEKVKDNVLGGVRKFTSGATFGFSDELAGVGGALGGIVGDVLTGNMPTWEGIKQSYYTERDKARAEEEAFKKEHPYLSTALEISGGIGTGRFIPTGKATSLMGKVKEGVKTGAKIGAIAGAGQAKELEDVPSASLASAVAGGAIGGAIPLVTTLATKTSQTVSGLVSKNARIKNLIGRDNINKVYNDVVSGKISSDPESVKTALLNNAKNKGVLEKIIKKDPKFGEEINDSVSKMVDKAQSEINKFTRNLANKQSSKVVEDVFANQRINKESLGTSEESLGRLYGMKIGKDGKFVPNEDYIRNIQDGYSEAYATYNPAELKDVTRNLSGELDADTYRFLMNKVSSNTFSPESFTQEESQLIQGLANKMAGGRPVEQIDLMNAAESVSKMKFDRIINRGTEDLREIVDLKSFITDKMAPALKDAGHDITKYKVGINNYLRQFPKLKANIDASANWDYAKQAFQRGKNILSENVDDIANSLKTDGIVDVNKLTGFKFGVLDEIEKNAVKGQGSISPIKRQMEKLGKEIGVDFTKDIEQNLATMKPQIESLHSINNLLEAAGGKGATPVDKTDMTLLKATLAWIKNASTIMWNTVINGVSELQYGPATKKALGKLINADSPEKINAVLKSYTTIDPLLKKSIGKSLMLIPSIQQTSKFIGER